MTGHANTNWNTYVDHCIYYIIYKTNNILTISNYGVVNKITKNSNKLNDQKQQIKYAWRTWFF